VFIGDINHKSNKVSDISMQYYEMISVR